MATRTALHPAVAPTTGPSFTVASLGKLGDVDRYELSLPQFKRPVRGKVFLKAILGLTGMEVSVTKLPAGLAVPFLHRHRTHEELYLVVDGRGEMQVDGQVFPLSEGSAIRVAPAGVRSIRAAPDAELTFVCIQAKADSMTIEEMGRDGEKLDGSPNWPR